jgi:hypothetical protein
MGLFYDPNLTTATQRQAVAAERQAAALEAIQIEVAAIHDEFVVFNEAVRGVIFSASRPGFPVFVQTNEVKESSVKKQVYKCTLPAVVTDAVRRELSVAYDGGTPTVTPIADVATTEVPDAVKAAVGVAVHAELRDFDAADNGSEPSVLDFVVADVIAPAKPGEFGVTATGEVEEA